MQPVMFGEVSQVGDEGCDDEDIPAQSPLLFLEVFDGLRPANILWHQTSHLKRRPRDLFFYFTAAFSLWNIL